jgi:hypothetical protein
MAKMPVMQFMAPNAMPCYSDPRTKPAEGITPDLPLVRVKKERETKTGKKKPFVVESVPPKRWRELFNKKPQLNNHEIAAIIGCSHTTVKNVRNRMGFKQLTKYNRSQKYFEKDARNLAKKRRKNERLCDLARRLGMKSDVVHHISSKFRDILPTKQ